VFHLVVPKNVTVVKGCSRVELTLGFFKLSTEWDRYRALIASV